eukprot:TRINITY_DN610_c0_g1_i2.p1 TRINITY_DN610_c0_g1~~TRINITY_DN610_c0_g1_i2.p1  ORF type:complete len:386 (+),score=43.65 TRINITY_DN610_c0_g1_i2:742-1899(+)
MQITHSDGPTPWRVLLDSWYWFLITVVMAVAGAASGTLAVIRLIQHWKSRGHFFMELPQYCLALELIGCLLRFLYWAIDPFNMRLIMSFQGGGIFRTWSASQSPPIHSDSKFTFIVGIPFGLASQVLLIFFWLETITNSRVQFSMNLTKFRIPAGLIIMIMFGIEILSLVLGSISVGTGDFNIVNTAVYMVVMIGLSIFYTVVAIKILVQLRGIVSTRGSSSKSSGGSAGSMGRTSTEPPKKHRVSSASLWKTTVRLLVSGLCLIFAVVVGFFTLSPWFLRQETAMVWVWLVIHIILHIRAFATILALRAPPRRSWTKQPATASSSKGPTAVTAVDTARSKSDGSNTATAAASRHQSESEEEEESEQAESVSETSSSSSSADSQV